MSIQGHTWGDGQTPSWPEAWPGWAGMPASVEYGLLEADAPPAPAEDPLSAAVRELKECLEEARGQRTAAEAARREAEAIAQAVHLQGARLAAELAAERGRAARLERDR